MSPRPNIGRRTVAFRLTQDERDWLDAEAERLGTDRTDIVRRALQHYRQLPKQQRTKEPRA